ncbi:ABC transporter substrate-binding protein [Amycolatopsis sp. NPDC059027]|uniref:ABC transporter substrate-binding protein n=1 Tax=unclassified Amycolatopsis TaxID=2618356 RepID=UPI003671F4CC
MFTSATNGVPLRRRTIHFALAALVATTVSGCGLLGGSDGSTSGGSSGGLEKSSIKVSVMSVIDTTPLRLAVDGGYFKAEGLDVQTIEVPDGQTSLTKLISGEADVAFSSYQPFFSAKAKNTADIRLVADAVSASPKSNEIITGANSSVKGIADLAGKKVAITAKNTASDLLTRSVLKDHGVDPNKVNWVQMGMSNVAPALKNGDIDAGYLAEPFLTQAGKTAGAVPLADAASGATQDFPLAGYGALGKFVTDSPKTLAAFQRAMQKATRDAADRAKIEPLAVKYAKVDQDTAALLTLPTFVSTLDARRLQRVPDLMQQMGAIPAKIDAAPMIAPQVSN